MKKTKVSKTKKGWKMKLVKSKVDMVQWLTCPHCKSLIMYGQPELVGTIRAIQKQYYLQRKKKVK